MTTMLVLLMIPQLGSPDYMTRELAHKRLESILPVAGPILLKARNHPDPEIAARVSDLAEKWAWRIADTLRPSKWPYMPWIDSLPHCYPNRGEIIERYMSLVNCNGGAAYGGGGPPNWSKYRYATKFFVQQLLLEGKSIPEIGLTLDAMASYEKGWVKSHQNSFKFPQEMLSACD